MSPRATARQHTQISPLWLCGAVLVVVGLLYSQVGTFGFLWDDDQVIYGRPDYRDPSRWLEAVRQPLDFSPNYFRPLALTTLLVQIWLWQDNPAPFHWLNLVFHLVNTLLVMAIAWRWLRHAFVSALAGLLYGLHPALVESVAFVSSRYDLAMTTFLLLAFWLSLAQDGWARYGAIGLLWFGALMCKEMAVMALLAFPAALWAVRKTTGSPQDTSGIRVREMGTSFGVFLILYVAVRWLTLGYLLTASPPGLQIETGNWVSHMLLVGRTFATLIGLVVFPFFSITPVHHSALPVPTEDWVAWFQLAFSVVVLMGLLVLTKRTPAVGGMFWAGILFLLPVLNLRPMEFAFGVFTAERFLTAPLAFFVLGVSAWMVGMLTRFISFFWKLAFLGVLIGGWSAGALVVSALTLPNWREAGIFWEWVTRASPRSPIGYSNLSDYLNKRGEHRKALEYAERAIEIAPQNGMGWINKGVALLRLGDTQGAIEMFRKGTQVEPENTIGWNNLAVMLAEQGQLDEAERIVKSRLLGQKPLFFGYQVMALIQMRRGRPDLAEPYVKDALSQMFDPQNSLPGQLAEQLQRADFWLASAYRALMSGDMALAQKLLERGKQLDPNKISLAYVQGMLLLKQGKVAEAEAEAESLLEYGYEDARLYELLALCAQARGDTARARAFYEKMRQRNTTR